MAEGFPAKTAEVTWPSLVAGEYGVHIKYDEQHVPDSPVIVQCIPASEDAKACTVHGLRDRGLEVNIDTFFFFFST